MSKKVNTENVVVETKKTLKDYFEEYPNASLRKLSLVCGINYGIMLKKSKEPISGQVYDPAATNWEAVEKKLTEKNVDYTTLDWDALNEGPNRKGAMLVKDMNLFTVGSKVYLRKNNSVPYEIVYKTDTHVVLMLEGTSEPIAWSNNTFLINGPVFQPRATKEVEEES